ncbi:MAG: PAS domain-containing protein [Bacteroidaceae bacterium]|nr:PAS domain-containing protein [Bacteroidaceae bacterium]
MNNKSTYQELENQIAELKKQNELFRQRFSLPDEAEVKGVDVLDIATNKRSLIKETEKESTESFKNFFTSNKAIMLQIHPETQKIISANGSAVDFYGYPRHELLQKRISDLNTLSPDEIDRLLKIAMKNKSNFFQFKHRIASREIKDVKVFSSPMTFNGELSMILTVYDNTERKKAEEDLKKNEAKFKLLSNLTFEGIVLHHNGIAIDVNLSFAKIFGYTCEEVIGKNLLKLVAKKEYHSTILKNISKKYAFPYEVVALKKDGTEFPLEIEARNIELDDKKIRVAAVRDVSERKIFQKELQKQNKELTIAKEKAEASEDKFRAIIDTSCHKRQALIHNCARFTESIHWHFGLYRIINGKYPKPSARKVQAIFKYYQFLC